MELLFNLLKHLAQTLSITEFVIVLTLIAGISLMIVKFILRLASKKGGAISNLLSDDSASTEVIISKLDSIMSKNIDRVMLAIADVKAQSIEQDESLRKQITDILLLKHDVDALSDSINRELEDLKRDLKVSDSHNHNTSENIREVLQRMQDLVQRIISQIDKIDEFTRAAVPEFRSYHKELSKEMSELNRDIALVERSIQSQINTTNAINLR